MAGEQHAKKAGIFRMPEIVKRIARSPEENKRRCKKPECRIQDVGRQDTVVHGYDGAQEADNVQNQMQEKHGIGGIDGYGFFMPL